MNEAGSTSPSLSPPPITVPVRDVVLTGIQQQLPRLRHEYPQIIYARQHLLENVLHILRGLSDQLEANGQATVREAVNDRRADVHRLKRWGLLGATGDWYPEPVWQGVQAVVETVITLLEASHPSTELTDKLQRLIDELEQDV